MDETSQTRWRRNHPEKWKEIRRKYYEKNKKKLAEKLNEWRKENREKVRVQNRKYLLSHPDRDKKYRQKKLKENCSEFLLRLHVRRIAKKIPLKERCEMCGERATERHHSDYSKPFEIVSLCKKCHVAVHRADVDYRERMELDRRR